MVWSAIQRVLPLDLVVIQRIYTTEEALDRMGEQIRTTIWEHYDHNDYDDDN
jgi:hypothetical protein